MFTNFLESLKTADNQALIESISQGYSVLHESFYQMTGKKYDNQKTHRIEVDDLHDKFNKIAPAQVLDSIKSQVKGMINSRQPDYKLLQFLALEKPMVLINNKRSMSLAKLPGYAELMEISNDKWLVKQIDETRELVETELAQSKKNIKDYAKNERTKIRDAKKLVEKTEKQELKDKDAQEKKVATELQDRKVKLADDATAEQKEAALNADKEAGAKRVIEQKQIESGEYTSDIDLDEMADLLASL